MPAKKPAKRTRLTGRSNAQLKRHYREKNRRMREARKRAPTPKERFVSGCMALLLAGAVAFVGMLTFTCIFSE